MKYYLLIIIALLLTSAICEAQKIGKNRYNKVDTVYEYINAVIVVYRNNNSFAKDTIWLTKQNINWHINEADVVNVFNDEKIKSNVKQPK